MDSESSQRGDNAPMILLHLDRDLVAIPGSRLGPLDGHGDLMGRPMTEWCPALAEVASNLPADASREVEFRVGERRFAGMLRANGATATIAYDVFATDVTEIGRREDALDLRERQVQLLMDTALDPVVTCDESSAIIAWNDSAAELFGWSAEEAIGATLTETIIPEDLRAAHLAGMKRFVATGEGPVLGARIEIEAVDRSGRRFPIELAINPLVLPDRRVFSAFIRDISDRVAAEARLVGSESRLQSALDAMQAGAWEYVLDEAGDLLGAVVDDQARDLLGVDAEMVPPKRSSIHDDDRGVVAAAWREASEGRSHRYEVEYRMLGPGDRVFWRREVGVLIPRKDDDVQYDGKPTARARMIGVVQDVTHEKELEETLASARRLEAVGQVASGFAHDLNNVLSAISGHATLAALGPDLPKKSVQSMEVIKDAVARGRALTQNMISLGRPSATQRDRIDLANVASETLKLAEPVLGAAIRVEADLPTGLGWIESDASQWQQAILNLVINARDAMSGHGLLEVSLRREDSVGDASKIVMEIRDTGKGMAAETVEMATRPFFTTKGKKGTGLGLAMVHRLVDAESGGLEIESQLDVGTTIRLWIPLAVEGDHVDDGPVDVTGCRVFLVEDHPLLRPMLAESLGNCGFEVFAVSDGAEALKQILDADPTVLVLDINLPGRRGDDLASAVRAELGRDVPVLFITGNNDFDPPKWPRTDFLRKPFELEDLNRKVRGLAT